MLEMMKEWKNNPESDEENTADEKTYWSIQEKLKNYHLKGNAHDANDSSDGEEGKQVRGPTKQVARTVV